MSDDLPTSTPLERLRAELDRDTRLLQSLKPGTDAHRRLSARVEQQTQKMLDKMEEKEAADRRFSEAMRAEAARREARKPTPEQESRQGGLIAVAVGAIWAYFAWGSWWIIAAVAVVLLGLALAIVAPS